jgi:hypothetical protein
VESGAWRVTARWKSGTVREWSVESDGTVEKWKGGTVREWSVESDGTVEKWKGERVERGK